MTNDGQGRCRGRTLDHVLAWSLGEGSADIQGEYERLTKRGVVFRTKPTTAGPVTVAVFEDTCGNLIQLAQK